jgi:transposase-like protein
MARIKYKEAIGLKVKRGRPAAGTSPSKADLIRLYVKESRSVRDVAATLGCSKDAVHRALNHYDIAVRSNASRSRLRTIPLTDLETAIRDKGIRGTARELGVAEGTIRHHLKVQRGL